MNEIDEIKRRMEKRRAHHHPTLTDRHFSRLYNGMIKCMVVLLVGVAICAYVKVSPNGEYIKDYVLNDMRFTELTKWVNNQLLSFNKKSDNAATVSSQVSYKNIKDNYYTNQSNEVLNFDKGRVIYVGPSSRLHSGGSGLPRTWTERMIPCNFDSFDASCSARDSITYSPLSLHARTAAYK